MGLRAHVADIGGAVANLDEPVPFCPWGNNQNILELIDNLRLWKRAKTLSKAWRTSLPFRICPSEEYEDFIDLWHGIICDDSFSPEGIVFACCVTSESMTEILEKGRRVLEPAHIRVENINLGLDIDDIGETVLDFCSIEMSNARVEPGVEVIESQIQTEKPSDGIDIQLIGTAESVIKYSEDKNLSPSQSDTD